MSEVFAPFELPAGEYRHPVTGELLVLGEWGDELDRSTRRYWGNGKLAGRAWPDGVWSAWPPDDSPSPTRGPWLGLRVARLIGATPQGTLSADRALRAYLEIDCADPSCDRVRGHDGDHDGAPGLTEEGVACC